MGQKCIYLLVDPPATSAEDRTKPGREVGSGASGQGASTGPGVGRGGAGVTVPKAPAMPSWQRKKKNLLKVPERTRGCDEDQWLAPRGSDPRRRKHPVTRRLGGVRRGTQLRLRLAPPWRALAPLNLSLGGPGSEFPTAKKGSRAAPPGPAGEPRSGRRPRHRPFAGAKRRERELYRKGPQAPCICTGQSGHKTYPS